MRRQMDFDSDSDDWFGRPNIKRVDCIRGVHSSDFEESDKDEEYQNQQQHEMHKSTSSHSQEAVAKSKAIKKNRESAKMSRSRKKAYITALEMQARDLQNDILKSKESIRGVSTEILSRLQLCNLEVGLKIFQKHRYLTEGLDLSTKLLKWNQQILELNDKNSEKEQISKTTPGESQLNQAGPTDLEERKEKSGEKHRGRRRKQVIHMAESEQKRQKKELQLKLKEETMDLAINTYMYKFGVRGYLRTEVIQRAKYQWVQQFKRLEKSPAPEKQDMYESMSACMQQLESQTRKLDYWLRELRNRVSDKFVVQCLLDKQFFMHNHFNIQEREFLQKEEAQPDP